MMSTHAMQTHSAIAPVKTTSRKKYRQKRRWRFLKGFLFIPSAKQILGPRPHEVSGILVAALPGKSPDERCRNAAGLAHNHPGGGRHLIGNRNHRVLQCPARPVGASDVVVEHLHAGCADREVELTEPPRPSERIGDDDRDFDAETLAELLPQSRGRSIRVDREERGLASGRLVRPVDSGVGGDESLGSGGDQMPVVHVQHFSGFLQRELDHGRIFLVLLREAARFLAGHHVFEPHDAPLGLGDDFLADDDDVAGTKLNAAHDRVADETGEIVAGPDRRNAGQRKNRYSAHFVLLRFLPEPKKPERRKRASVSARSGSTSRISCSATATPCGSPRAGASPGATMSREATSL